MAHAESSLRVAFKKGELAMGIFAKWREKFAPIRFLVNAQKTPWYPVLFAALCIIGGTHDHTVYIPVLWILAAFVLFSVFFADDNKVFLAPMLMIFFALGQDTSADAFADSNGDMLAFMDKGAFVQVIAICVICVGAFVARLIIDGSVAAAFKRRRLFTVSIIAMDIAFLANGLFSPEYDIVNLGYGAFFAMGFTVVYFLVCGMLEHSDDPITYGCYCMLGTAYVALLQILTVVARLINTDKFFIVYSDGTRVINKACMSLGWGISTVIAAVFVLGIPAAMYLSKERRLSLFYFASSVLFIIGTVIINVRSAMVVSAAVMILCTVICCIKGKNRVKFRIYSVATAILIIVGLILVDRLIVPISKILDEVFYLLRFNLNADSGRSDLWYNGISDFLSSPVFGKGFNDGGYSSELRNNNVFSNMYHCILIQIPGAMGMAGCLAFITHIVSLGIAFFKKFSCNKLFLLMIPLMILGMSLADNFFFYLHFQIFYGAFLALAEKSSEP